MSRRSQVRNQFETQLSGTLAVGSFVMAVDSTAGFEIDEPIYLAIDPDVPGTREWVRVISITGNTFNIDPSPNDHGANGRNLDGSDGDLEHLSGAKVRSVSTEQIYLDIFQDQEDGELDLTQHQTDGGDPHAQAGYLTQDETDLLYVQLAGSTLDALAFIKTPETSGFSNEDLVPKIYVDAADVVVLSDANAYSDSLDHDHATPIAAHAAIADAHQPTQTFLHEDLTDVSPDQHHVAFVEADADLLYLPLTGGAMSGPILQGNGTAAAPSYSFGGDTDIGMYRASANDIALAAFGTEVFRSNGNRAIFGGLTTGNPNLEHGNPGFALPAYAFFGDDDTGMFRISANSLGFSTGGSARLTITTAVATFTIPLDMGNDRISNVDHLHFGNNTGLGNVNYSLVYNDSYFRFRSGATNDILTLNGNEINFDMDDFNAPGMSTATGTTMVHNGTRFGPQSSSRRFKKNLKRIDKASIKAALSKLSVYEYQYKDIPDETHIGWMAEDLAEIHPMLATYDKDGKVFAINQLAVLSVLT